MNENLGIYHMYSKIIIIIIIIKINDKIFHIIQTRYFIKIPNKTLYYANWQKIALKT